SYLMAVTRQHLLVMPRLQSMAVGGLLGHSALCPYVFGSYWADTWVRTLHGFLVLGILTPDF
ncbi:MAG: hypothetical protein SH847_07785, partial [Roseiflexaceae bacterium]|nr:hypothetical protein [Roseiflexaceae bacterium]